MTDAHVKPAARAGWLLRNAEIRDLPELLELMIEHARFEKAAAPTASTRMLADALFADLPRAHAWVVEGKTRLVGYVAVSLAFSAWAAGDYLHMDCLYLRENVRNQGIGVALLATVRDFAMRHDITEVQWQTPAWNENATRFYRREGARDDLKRRFALDSSRKTAAMPSDSLE
jgi:GNAT superfamily N-acetyltransferase